MHSLSAFPVCLQIQKPVVNTNMEKLAQELEELARTQVRRGQRPHWAGRSQRPGRWERVGCLDWEGARRQGRGLQGSHQ